MGVCRGRAPTFAPASIIKIKNLSWCCSKYAFIRLFYCKFETINDQIHEK